jgi:hypothetical protein
MVRTFLKVYMELGSYFLFLQEQIKDIIISSRTFSFLKVFGDFVVPNVTVVSRTSKLNRVDPASMTKVQPALAIAVTISVLASFQSRELPVNFFSVDDYGSHHMLLAARVEACAPEGWMCQRICRVPLLVPLVTQTLLSRTRPWGVWFFSSFWDRVWVE